MSLPPLLLGPGRGNAKVLANHKFCPCLKHGDTRAGPMPVFFKHFPAPGGGVPGYSVPELQSASPPEKILARVLRVRAGETLVISSFLDGKELQTAFY